MGRTCDVAFFECPICGKKPYVETYDVNVAWAYCKGYGFYRHRKLSVFVPSEQPSNLLKKLSQKWNQTMYEEARFLFRTNGNPFKKYEQEQIDVHLDKIASIPVTRLKPFPKALKED